MKEKTIKLYSYDELNPKAKEKALYDFRSNNLYLDLEGNLRAYLKELLIENNIKFECIPLKLFYSLSYSQGDGFCFIGKFEFKEFEIKISHKGHYYHKKSVYIEGWNSEGEYIEKDKLKEFIDIYDKICDKCEKLGYEYIEEEDSEERIKDYYISNEITFRENGEIEKCIDKHNDKGVLI